MRRLAPLLAAALAAAPLLGGCRPCLQPGVDDCSTLRVVSADSLRAATWLLDAEAFGRRDAPSPGAVRAAHYAAAQLQAAGLQPGGDAGTYLQRVALTVTTPRQATLTLLQGDVELTLANERDFHLLEAHGAAQVKVDAEVVQADTAPPPATAWLRGRVALVTVRQPTEAPLAAATVARLRTQGVAGVLLCTRGPGGRDAYHTLRERLQRPAVRLAGTAPPPAGGAARLVYALAPRACEQLLATAAAAPAAPAGSPVLPLRVRGEARLVARPEHTWNAIGVYRPARDPRAAPLVLSARLDGPGVDLAGLLEIGRVLVQLKAQPPRPIVLLAAAGTPAGPVGLEHFARAAAGPPRGTTPVVLHRVPAARRPLEAARLVEALVRGAQRGAPP